MRTFINTAVMVAGMLFFGAPPAAAQDPPPPDPPANDITVVVEPPGDNCVAGGIKVTVTPVAEDPEAPPEPQVYYLCNGQDGEPGPEGPPGEGEPVEPGQEGPPGQDGLEGPPGEDGNSAESFPSGNTTRVCASASVVRMKLPLRFRGVRRVTLYVDGQRHGVRVQRRRVRLDLRRLECGYYPVLVSKRGIKPALRIWHLTPGGASVSSVLKF